MVSEEANDNDCVSCTGLLYFSEALKAEGKLPICFGLSKVDGKIAKERMEKLNSYPLIGQNTSVYCLGLTRMSRRMMKNGQMPIVITGVQYVVKSTANDNKSNETFKLDYPTVVAKYEAFSKKFIKFSEKYVKSMKSLFNRTTEDLPNRMLKSSERIIKSGQRILELGAKQISKYIFEDDQKKR